MLNINICLTDIPKDKIYTAQNGKQYVRLSAVELRQPDKYENTHTVYVSQTKEQREAKEAKTYVGNGKKLNFNNG